MFSNLAAGAVGLLKAAFTVVALFFALIIFATWAHDHPQKLSSMGDSIGNMAAAVVTKTCDSITSALGGTPSES